MNTQDLINYYVNLLIVQYYDKPKARAEIGLWITQVVSDQIASLVRDGFDIDTAIGKQLTTLGKYVNATRRVNGLTLDREFMTLPAYDYGAPDSVAGLYDYATADVDVVNYTAMYTDVGNTYNLNDTEMRLLIKYMVRLNTSDYSLSDIDDILNTFFNGDCLLTDNEDMTITYTFTPALTYTLPYIIIYLGILPAPAGVTIITTGV